MDITCKCGHNVRKHGEWDCSECDCEFGETQVYDIFITEQQARLDTNRAQVVALVSERDALKKQLERMSAMHFALKGAVRYARDMTLSETIRQAMIIALERDKNYE